jgi:hypothetical protein
MDQWRSGLNRTIVDLIERLRGRMPCIAVQDVPQGLLRAVQGVPVLVLKLALDFEQLGFDGVAVHQPSIADSPMPCVGLVSGHR